MARSAVIVTGAVQEATPLVLSKQENVAVTLVLFQPAVLGGGLTLAVIVGRTLSTPTIWMVKLLPGEVTVLKVPAADVRETLEALDGKATLTVTYEVSEFWGKRFGVWHGKLTCSAVPPK